VTGAEDVSAFSPAGVMLRALREKRTSSSELLELHLSRIERHNPKLNAVVTPAFEAARATARERDAVPARGVLHGLPVTIKDTIDVAGLPTTSGDPRRRAAIAARHAPVTESVLDRAGAVLMGKTNVSLRAGDWQASNALFGRTLNPWDESRSPGGSTGGGAAAVAAGMTPLEIGSDIGGSIRVPAAFCGVFGHRPSETLVPRSGHVPGHPRPNPAALMLVMGPLARSAEDLRLAIGVVAGPEQGEEVAWRAELPAARGRRIGEFRVATLPRPSWLPLDDSIAEALERVAVASGAVIAQPDGFDLLRHDELYTALLAAMLFAEVKPAARATLAETLRASDQPMRDAQLRGLLATASDLLELLDERAGYQEMWRGFFREFDVLLAPVTIANAFPHIPDDVSFPERHITIRGQKVPYRHLQVYPGLAALSGLPATAFPAGRSDEGLPVGLQAVGPYLEDLTPIEFAAAADRELGCSFQEPPGYGDLEG
jgi:amidase